MTAPLLGSLNPAQREAVEHVNGPLLVLAGAGSGKTRVLTARMAILIESHGVAPDRIFAVTFTNKAAAEMKDRIGRLLDRDPTGLWIGTFHSLSARLLRREAEYLGFSRQFTIYDEDDRIRVIRRLLEQQGHPAKLFPPKAVQAIISSAKNRMKPPSELLAASTFNPMVKVAAEVYAALGPALRSANAMDFDDLMLHPLTLFREHPDRLEAYRRKFQYRAGGRIPGHQSRPVRADPRTRLARQRLRRGRRRPVHLRLAWGRGPQHGGLPARFRRGAPGPPRGELPLHPGGARRRQRGHRREHRPHRQDAPHRAPRGRGGHAARRGRRARRGGVDRRRAAEARGGRRLGLRRDGGALPYQRPVARHGRGVPAERRALPDRRGHQLLRPPRGEGPAGVPPAGGQPRRRRGVPSGGAGAAARPRRLQSHHGGGGGAPVGQVAARHCARSRTESPTSGPTCGQALTGSRRSSTACGSSRAPGAGRPARGALPGHRLRGGAQAGGSRGRRSLGQRARTGGGRGRLVGNRVRGSRGGGNPARAVPGRGGAPQFPRLRRGYRGRRHADDDAHRQGARVAGRRAGRTGGRPLSARRGRTNSPAAWRRNGGSATSG